MKEKALWRPPSFSREENGQWWQTKGNKKHGYTHKKERPLQFPAKTEDWNYPPAAFVSILQSFSQFRTNKAGCIRSHGGGSLVAHQAAGRPQENATAAGEGRSVKCTSQPHRHTQLLLSFSHTVTHTHTLNALKKIKKNSQRDLSKREGKIKRRRKRRLQVGRAEDERGRS